MTYFQKSCFGLAAVLFGAALAQFANISIFGETNIGADYYFGLTAGFVIAAWMLKGEQ